MPRDASSTVLLYGGQRLLEALRLRVKDLDFERREISVREGKGDKDRLTMLPQAVVRPLQERLRRVEAIHQQDLTDGDGRVELPHAHARKYPNAKTGDQGRHHINESLVQRSIKEAVRKAGPTKRVTSHAFRHSFATQLLTCGYDIRTVQELPGHIDVHNTMIYTHVLNRGGRGVRSPADALIHRPDAR